MSLKNAYGLANNLPFEQVSKFLPLWRYVSLKVLREIKNCSVKYFHFYWKVRVLSMEKISTRKFKMAATKGEDILIKIFVDFMNLRVEMIASFTIIWHYKAGPSCNCPIRFLNFVDIQFWGTQIGTPIGCPNWVPNLFIRAINLRLEQTSSKPKTSQHLWDQCL